VGPVGIAITSAMKNPKWCGYPTVKKIKIWLFVSTEYTNVPDGRKDGQTPHDGIGRGYV